MGIYVFNYDRLVELLKTDNSWVDFGREIIPAAIDKLQRSGPFFQRILGRYRNHPRVLRSESGSGFAACRNSTFSTRTRRSTPRSRYLPPSKLHGCDIDNSMVSEGCIMNGVYARSSIIGLRSRLDGGVRIEDSIIMGSDIFESIEEIRSNLANNSPHVGIGENTVIRRAIVDKNVRIGKNVRLLNNAGIDNSRRRKRQLLYPRRHHYRSRRVQ